MSNLLRIKPMSMLTQEAAEQGEHTLKRSLGALNLVTLGIGAVIGAGIFTLTGRLRRCVRALRLRIELCGGGIHLRFCRSVLCRIRLDHSHRRFGLHVRLCDARRTGGLDYRLGPLPGVRLRRFYRGLGLGGLLQQPPAAVPYLPSAADYRHTGTPLVFYHDQWMPLMSLPPGVSDVGLRHATGAGQPDRVAHRHGHHQPSW